MSDSTCEIIFHESKAAGDDTEHNSCKDGIVVTLSFWYSSDSRVRSHYLLERRVMINRKFIIDEQRLMGKGKSNHAWQIRTAIAEMDQLMQLYPEVAQQGEGCYCLEIAGDIPDCPHH